MAAARRRPGARPRRTAAPSAHFGERMVFCCGVGDRGHRRRTGGRSRGAMISIFSMTTGFSGASDLNGPTAPVGVSPMRSIDVHALHDVAEHRVAPAGRHRVEVGVVDQVDVELRIAGVRRSPRASPTVPRLFCRPLPDSLKTLSCVGFRCQAGGVVAAALDDEVRDHAVEQGVGVEALAHVAQEVRRGERRAVRAHLDDELAHVGGDPHLRVRRPRRAARRRGSRAASEQRRRAGRSGSGS